MDSFRNAIDDNVALDWVKGECPMIRTHSYPFSWGVLNESVTSELGVRCVDFEFSSPDVYLAFPRSWHLVDLFSWMYHKHPLRHHTFVPNLDVVFNTTVIFFKAKGEREISSLRNWLVEVYVPLIWLDLQREAMKIVSEIKASLTDPESLEKLVANWSGYLCEDPKSLSFYKAPSN